MPTSNSPSSAPRTSLAFVEAQDLEARPISQASTLPAPWYVDPAISAFERDAIFRRTWQYIGPADPVALPNSWHVCEVGGLPLLAVRGADKTLRALHNVCRHRAGPLAFEDGKGRILTCRYHGWSYTLDGKLAGTPHFEGVENFDKKTCRVPEASAATWANMLFGHADPAAPKLDEALAGIGDRISEHYDLSTMTFQSRVTYDIDCDWKTYVDNYLEGYHVGMVHPELAQVLDVSNYKYEATERWTLQHSPIEDVGEGANPYGKGAGWA